MTNKAILLDLVGDTKLPKHEFEDLEIVAQKIEGQPVERVKSVLSWFLYLHSIETTGWRTKEMTEKLVDVLMHSQNIKFYALFCPSYKKGDGASGFRIDDVGNTTRWGLQALQHIGARTKHLGFNVGVVDAIFFDLALEQPDKVLNANDLTDFQLNISNFRKALQYANETRHWLSPTISMHLLSELFGDLEQIIGKQGVKLDPMPIEDGVFERVVERGRKFYELFNWTEDQIIERSKVICSSEALVGYKLRQYYDLNAIMVYTPTMLERASVYQGKMSNNPIPMIFPKHSEQ